MTAPGGAGFFARRWRGELPLRVLLWRDMLAFGTLLNLLAAFAALALAALHADLRVALALHLAPTPYNLFLFAALWRSPQRTLPASVIGLVWLVMMTIV